MKLRRFRSAGVEMTKQCLAALREDWLSKVYIWQPLGCRGAAQRHLNPSTEAKTPMSVTYCNM